MVYTERDWKLVGFRRSDKKDKKVVAILENKDTGKTVKVHFGQRGSSTYRDLTGVGGDSVHGDRKKREAYRARHAGEGSSSRKYSPGWLSYHTLW